MQGFTIGIRGWNFQWATALFGDLADRQSGMGYGALVSAPAILFLFTHGIAARGAINVDVFVVSPMQVDDEITVGLDQKGPVLLPADQAV